jgi:hypothetical protein
MKTSKIIERLEETIKAVLEADDINQTNLKEKIW